MIAKLLNQLFPKKWKLKKVDETTLISPLGRDRFVYQEGNRRLIFYAEITSGKVRRWVQKSSIRKWEPPHDGEEISEELQKHIIKKIAVFFQINDISFEFY